MVEAPHLELRREAAALLADFSAAEIAGWDQAEHMPDAVVARLGRADLLGTFVDPAFGGRGSDALAFGHLCAAFGECSMSLLSIVTVHSMVLEAIRLWGTPQQREHWLPLLARGDCVGAFALTEPEFGSDATGVSTIIADTGDSYRITGRKKWISYACKAGVLLVFGKLENGKDAACLLPVSTSGLSIQSMQGLLGFRAAMVGTITMDNCVVPKANLIGVAGAAVAHVAASALDLGRLAIAFGCLGAMEACLADSVAYARQRKQFGQPLARHQLIQQMLADMITAQKAALRLCTHAAELRNQGDPLAAMETAVAKYFTSTNGMAVANNAVQIHGAVGCSASEARCERYYRDLKITEIIEGSNQMQQMMIAQNGMGAFMRPAARRPGAQGD